MTMTMSSENRAKEEAGKIGHTPGPLEVKKAPKSARTGILFAKGDHGTAHFVTYKNDKYSGEIACCFGENAKANADLYSASPDLYEACKKAYAAIGAVGLKLSPDAPPWQEPLLEAFAALRAAISKAEGKV